MKLILAILVLTEALYEGLYDRKAIYVKIFKWQFNLCKLSSKFVQSGFLVTVFWFGLKCTQLGWFNDYIWTYLLFRISLFNYVNALAAGRKTLLGTTSIIDRLIRILTLGSLWMYILVTLLALIGALII